MFSDGRYAELDSALLIFPHGTVIANIVVSSSLISIVCLVVRSFNIWSMDIE